MFSTVSSCFYLHSSSLKQLEDMIEPFRLRGVVDAMQKEQPWKITDEELNRFEEKVSSLPFSHFAIIQHRLNYPGMVVFGVKQQNLVAVLQTNLQIRLNELLQENSKSANLIIV